jgi:hypothetical protein
MLARLVQLSSYVLVSAHCLKNLTQQEAIQLLHNQLIRLVSWIPHQTHRLARKEGKMLLQ